MRPVLLSILAVLFPLAAWADEKGKSDPPGVPVEATLVAKKDTYKLDLGGKSADDFRKDVNAAFEGDGKVPSPVAVDLELRLRNTSDKPVQVWVSGDPTRIELDLRGKGVLSGVARRAFTREFRLPKAVTIEPGKTHAIPIKGLAYGFRGQEKQAFWTEAGEHTLAATFQTAVSPAPKGAKEAEDGFGRVSLTTPPIKLKVEAP
jgi:hypothetical protein